MYRYKSIISVALAIIILTATTTQALATEKKPPIDLSKLPVESIALFEEESGRLLYSKNENQKTQPASTAKIMTMLLAMEAIEKGTIKLDDMVTCSRNSANKDGVTIWLEEGEKIPLEDLLKSVAVSSANDASVAIGEHIAGTEAKFVIMMNERAKKLKMLNTNFTNASGLEEPNNHSTAFDIGIMSCELLRHDIIKDYTTIWIDSLRGGKTELVNTNRLIRFYKGTTGLKTGTSTQGHSLVASATKNNLSLVAVVTNAKTSDERFEAAKSVLDYGFGDFHAVKLPEIDVDLKPIKVLNGVDNTVGIKYNAPEYLALNASEKDSITWEISIANDVKAPVLEGQVLGKVIVSVLGKPVCEYPLLANENVPQMTFIESSKLLWKSVTSMKS